MLLLGILMGVWSLIILPIIIKVNIALSDDCLPVAVFHIKTIGVSLHVKCRVTANKNGFDLKVCVQHRTSRPEKSVNAIGNRNEKVLKLIKSDQQLLENLYSYVSSSGMHLKLRIGAGDAAVTALICGSLSSALGCFPSIRLQIIPDFRAAQVCMQLKCIASFRLGKLLISAAVLLRAAVLQAVRKKSGGLAHG